MITYKSLKEAVINARILAEANKVGASIIYLEGRAELLVVPYKDEKEFEGFICYRVWPTGVIDPVSLSLQLDDIKGGVKCRVE